MENISTSPGLVSSATFLLMTQYSRRSTSWLGSSGSSPMPMLLGSQHVTPNDRLPTYNWLVLVICTRYFSPICSGCFVNVYPWKKAVDSLVPTHGTPSFMLIITCRPLRTSPNGSTLSADWIRGGDGTTADDKLTADIWEEISSSSLYTEKKGKKELISHNKIIKYYCEVSYESLKYPYSLYYTYSYV